MVVFSNVFQKMSHVRIDKRVQDLDAAALAGMNVPRVVDVVDFVCTGTQQRSKTVVFDLKVVDAEQCMDMVCSFFDRRGGTDRTNVVFLVWTKLRRRPPSRYTVLRAVNTTFRVPHDHVDGVACKYDGSEANETCIAKALQLGLRVNMYCTDVELATKMVDRYSAVPSCTFTVRANVLLGGS